MKQIFKKTLALTLAFLLVLPTACFGTFAESIAADGEMVASKQEMYKDEEVTISLLLSGNKETVGSAQMSLFYNSSAFAYVDKSLTSDYFVPHSVHVNNQVEKSVIKLSVSGGFENRASGNLVSLTFRPTSSAVVGQEYEFSFGNKDLAILLVTSSPSTNPSPYDGDILSSGTYEDGAIFSTVKVKLLERTWSVTYTDGVVEETVFPDQGYTVGEGKPTPAFSSGIPERAGYVFDGWTPAVAETVTSDAIYTATWIKTWEITYNDGVEEEEIFPDQTYTVKEGDPIPVYSGATPEREGYTFVSWSVSSGAAAADTVIVPVWSKNPVYYSVTYTDGVEGEVLFEDQTHVIVESSATPAFSSGIASSAVPQREGYVFTGWAPEVASLVTSDAIYRATWKKLFTVTYTDGVEEEEIFPDQTYTVKEGDPFPVYSGATPEREGYYFRGWNVPSGAVASSAAVTPVWVLIPVYAVTYTDGTGSGAVFADQVYRVYENTATPVFSSGIPSSALPQREGYRFEGWSPVVAETVTSDAVYTAVWRKYIRITYNDGVEGEELFPDQEYVILEGEDIPAYVGPSPKREGYVFFGWNVPSGAISEDFRIVPNWEQLAVYTVTYRDGAGSSAFAEQVYSVYVGSATPAFSSGIPQREGYIFREWSPKVAETVTGNAVYTAVWTKVYTVRYTDGVESDAIFADQIYSVEENKATPVFSGATPARTGYRFDGWTPAVAAQVTADVTYTAKWIRVYTVTYNDGVEGEVLFADQVYTTEDPSAIPNFEGDAPVREGYMFQGWNKPALPLTDDVTITPNWKALPTFTVTYKDGVGGTAFADQSYTVVVSSPTPAFSSGIPQRIGYVFAGWTPEVVDTVTADRTYTASWIPAFVITYTDGVEGEVLFPDQIYSVLGSSATPVFSGATPQRTGYVFDGWTPAVAETVTSDAVYAAAWKKLYTVTYTDGVEGEEIFPDQTYTVPEGDPVPVYSGAIPARYGYEFRGWNVPSGAIAADIAITPVWYKLPTYTVTYTDGVESAAVFADQVYTVVVSSATPAFSSGIPQREGYTFLGWAPEVAEIVTSDAVYTALWEVIVPQAPTDFTVYFVTEAGTSSAITVQSGAVAAKPAVPQKNGCGFAGWYLDAAFTQKYDFAAPVTEDTVLYARFFLWGDVNCDGVVTVYDADLIFAYVMEVDNPDMKNIMAGSVHGTEGFVTVNDADYIFAFIMESIDRFPVESYTGYEFDLDNFTVIAPQEN